MKIVLNKCFGGFSVSKKAAEFMAERGNKRAKLELADKDSRWYGYGYVEGMDGCYPRQDPDLVAAVEALGPEADGSSAKLVVVDIPEDIIEDRDQWDWIDEYNGIETVHEPHASW